MNATDRVFIIGFLLLAAYVLYVPSLLRWWMNRKLLREWDQAMAAHQRRVQEIDAAARDIEETRLMPGFEQRDLGDENDDQVAEGLGMMRREPEYLGRRWVRSPRRIECAAPSHVHSSAPIDASLQRALDEIAREPHA